jgi:hypothetical protein
MLATTYMPTKAQRTHLHSAGIPIRIRRRHRDIFKKIMAERESGIPRICHFTAMVASAGLMVLICFPMP